MVFDLWFCRDNCVSVRTAGRDQDQIWSSWLVRAAIKGSGVLASSCMDRLCWSAWGRHHQHRAQICHYQRGKQPKNP